jgi:hypothetical protein
MKRVHAILPLIVAVTSAAFAAGPAIQDVPAEFSRAVLAGDQKRALELSLPDDASVATVKLICELATEAKRLEDATRTAKVGPIFAKDQWLLNEIDAYPRRKEQPKVEGDKANFSLSEGTIQLQLIRSGDEWKVNPQSIYAGSLPQRLNEIRAEIVAFRDLLPQLKAGKFQNEQDLYNAKAAALNHELVRLNSLDPPLVERPADLSSPSAAYIEAKTAMETGNGARLADAAIGADPATMASLQTTSEQMIAAREFLAAVEKKCVLFQQPPRTTPCSPPMNDQRAKWPPCKWRQ